MSEVKDLAKKIEDIADDVSKYYVLRSNLNSFIKSLKGLSQAESAKRKKEVLKGRSEGEWISFYDNYILQQLTEIKTLNDSMTAALKDGNLTTTPFRRQLVPESAEKIQATSGFVQVKYPEIPLSIVPSKGFVSLDNRTKKRYLRELNVELDYLRSLVPSELSKKKVILSDYTLYQSSPYGKYANRFFENYSLKVSKNYPQFDNNLSHNLRAADIKVLSKTYISMMFLSSLIGFFISFLFAVFLIDTIIPFRIVFGFLIAIMFAVGVFIFMYVYPSIVASSRKRHIRDDLPFVVLHMAAVAGSGAQPISMFNLILSSREYSGVEGEIKKIVNYVNLFGYNLTTALRAVSITTPSEDFRDLLNGLVSSIESGGELKAFLTSKADETMTNYRLERRKYVETLETYSDIYTSVLIAAPLLFFITLAIIRMFGTDFMGMSISTIAMIGTYGLIPALNVGFLLFLNMVQPSST